MSDGDCQLNTFSREVTLMINCVRFAIFSLRLFYAWNVLDQAPESSAFNMVATSEHHLSISETSLFFRIKQF